MRGTKGRVRFVVAGLVLVGALAVPITLPVQAGASTSQAPGSASVDGAARAATDVRLVKSISHTLRGNFNGAGPIWEDFSTPAIADVTGDRVPEIVMATMDGFVFVYRASDYRLLWKRDLGRTGIEASPAVRQLGGSAAADVVIATLDGRVLVLDGPTGRTLVTMTQGGSPAGRPTGFHGTPAIADIDGDGRADIVASNFDHNLYAWTASGRPIFKMFLFDTSWSSPVVADINGDRRPEVLVGGDIYENNPLRKPKGGLLWAFTRGRGRWETLFGYPISIPGQVVWSTPAVGDVNGDGFPDVVVGTGNHFTPVTSVTQRVYAFTARTAQPLPGWPISTTGQVSNGPAIGDIDGDRRLDVAFASEGARVWARNRDGKAKWSACAGAGGRCATGVGAHAAVALADIDRDGRQDVVTALDRDLIVYDGKTGSVKSTVRFQNGTYIPSSGTPSVASVGGRGLIAVQAQSHRTGPPAAGDKVTLFLFQTGPLGTTTWPTFKRSVTRSG